MAALAMGAVDAARRFAKKNVAVLADAVRQGYEIVATEPAAALCLTREYPALFDDDETRLVAANTSEACAYLWRLHRQGKLQLDFKPMAMTLGYHAPCMIKALDAGSPGENLLRLVPGLVVDSRETGCSGMAGTFGLKRENYRSSLRAGWDLVTRMRAPAIQAGTTECSTCRIQMEQGTTKPTLHPIKILALAYGLMPQLDRLLTTRGHDLLLT
jgi:Fe-S oxidoreductase